MEDGLDAELAIADLPQGAALVLAGPLGDGVVGDRPQAGGDGVGVVDAVVDRRGGQLGQVAGDHRGLRAGIGDGLEVGRVVHVAPLHRPLRPRQAQVGVETLHRVRAEAELEPHLVADGDVELVRVGHFPDAAAPRAGARQRDRDRLIAQRLEPGQGQGLDGGGPVDVDGGVGVEDPREDAADEPVEGIAQQAGVVEELAPVGVAAVVDELVAGVLDQLAQLGQGRLGQAGLPVGVAGEGAEGLVDHARLGGPVGHVDVADLLRPDQTAHQRAPAAEHDGRPRSRFGSGEVLPPVDQRPEVQRVDPRVQALADGDRFDTEPVAQALVLVLDVAQDEGLVAEVGHAQHERLGGAGLAAAGVTEAEHVGVGDRNRVIEGPADRVGVERSPGEVVHTDLRAGRGQAGAGHERPQRGRLV